MKALDTPVLLELLEGRDRAVRLLKKWRGSEVATTEANLLELAVLIALSPSKVRAHRQAALQRLRRRITVLPLDGRAGEEAAVRAGKLPLALAPTVLGMLSALEVSGCEELVTDAPDRIPGRWRFRVSKIGR